MIKYQFDEESAILVQKKKIEKENGKEMNNYK